MPRVSLLLPVAPSQLTSCFRCYILHAMRATINHSAAAFCAAPPPLACSLSLSCCEATALFSSVGRISQLLQMGLFFGFGSKRAAGQLLLPCTALAAMRFMTSSVLGLRFSGPEFRTGLDH